MSAWVIGVVIVLIIGIVYVSNESEKKDLRKKHLDDLVKFLDARMEEISGRPNSFVLHFVFRGIPFVYEDIEDAVFEKKIYRGSLRVELPVNFNVVFTEGMKTTFRSAALEVPDEGSNQIEPPRVLKEFNIFSNRVDVARELFSDDAALRIFSKFKTKDSRGRPEMALEMVDGILTLKFYPLGQQMEPTIFNLRHNTGLIQTYLDDLLVIYRQVKKISDNL